LISVKSVSSFLFAKAVFDTPQTKFSSLGTNVVSSYTLNCLLKLQQSTAIFQIDTLNNPPSVVDIYQWSDVYPPGISANPDVPLYIVRELGIYGDSSLLQNTSDAEWTVGTTYTPYLVNGELAVEFTVTNSTTSWVQVAASQCHPNDLAVANRVLLLQTPDGFFRSVKNVVASGSNYQFNLNVTNDGTYNNYPLPTAPGVGSHVRLYRSEEQIFYSQITGGPVIPIATNGTPGLAYGGTGTYMPGGGAIDVFGMLQTPSTGSGRVLTSADNLNSVAYASGLYTADDSAGYPANMPYNYASNVWIHNIGNGTSSANGSDVTGIGGFPPYWRQGYNSGADWTNWMPLVVIGRKSLQAANFESQYTSTNFIPTASSVHTIGPFTFTPATYGQVMGIIIKNNAANNGTSATSAVSVTSSTLGTTTDSDHTQLTTQQIAVQQVAPGDTVTITGTITQDAGGGGPQMGIKLTYIFIPQW
jgi:hypothetical protein